MNYDTKNNNNKSQKQKQGKQHNKPQSKQNKPLVTKEQMNQFYEYCKDLPVITKFYPLEIHEHQAVHQYLKDKFKHVTIKNLLFYHCNNIKYHKNVLNLDHRYKLDGTQGRPIPEKAKEHARQKLSEIQKKMQNKKYKGKTQSNKKPLQKNHKSSKPNHKPSNKLSSNPDLQKLKT